MNSKQKVVAISDRELAKATKESLEAGLSQFYEQAARSQMLLRPGLMTVVKSLAALGRRDLYAVLSDNVRVPGSMVRKFKSGDEAPGRPGFRPLPGHLRKLAEQLAALDEMDLHAVLDAIEAAMTARQSVADDQDSRQ